MTSRTQTAGDLSAHLAGMAKVNPTANLYAMMMTT